MRRDVFSRSNQNDPNISHDWDTSRMHYGKSMPVGCSLDSTIRFVICVDDLRTFLDSFELIFATH